NDDPPATLSVNDVTVTERDTANVTANVTVTLSQPMTVPVSYTLATDNTGTATAGSDFTARTLNLTFLAGQTSRTVSITVLPDAVHEGTETIGYNAGAITNAAAGDVNGTITILDNE